MLGAIAGAIGGSLASWGADHYEARAARKWQKHMSDTAHRREVNDLRLAGLNPILSAGGGARPLQGQPRRKLPISARLSPAPILPQLLGSKHLLVQNSPRGMPKRLPCPSSINDACTTGSIKTLNSAIYSTQASSRRKLALTPTSSLQPWASTQPVNLPR